MKQQDKHNYRPYYDRRHRRWRVEFPDRDAEEGDILYVACEFARTGLFFPYNDSVSKEQGFHDHSHDFEGVLEALLEDPAGFTIEGFEEYYSEQEKKMLRAVQEKLQGTEAE